MAKAWEIEGIAPDAPLHKCARRIIETRFREVMHYREGTISGEDIEDLHAMRVSTRRLRSAMRNFRRCFAPGPFRQQAARIRDIADKLGVVRDHDVRMAWLIAYRTTAPEEEHLGVDALLERARADRDLARRPMVELMERLDREGYEQEFLEFVWGGSNNG